MTFIQHMYNGMGAAGWVIGFLTVLGLFLIFSSILILGIIAIADAIDEREEAKAIGSAEGSDGDGDAAGVAKHRRARIG